ncbi:hypothetical protein D3C85_1358990 [compost metagenome]
MKIIQIYVMGNTANGALRWSVMIHEPDPWTFLRKLHHILHTQTFSAQDNRLQTGAGSPYGFIIHQCREQSWSHFQIADLILLHVLQ